MNANRKEEQKRKEAMGSATGGGGVPLLSSMGGAGQAATGGEKRPIPKTHQEESDYSEDDFDNDEGEAREKKKEIENRQQLNLLKEKRAGAASQAVDEEFDQAKGAPDLELDALWTSLRDELHKVDPTLGARGGPAQTKSIPFADACKMYDARNEGYVSIADLQKALTKARVQPRPTDQELERIVTALEAWHAKSAKTVFYGRLLDATRATVSQFGFFPKQEPRGPTPQERAQKARAEEEQRKKEAEEELRKAKEASQANKRSTPAAPRGLSKAQSKEEQRRLQKEEQQRKEAERKEAERLQKEEEEAVKIEVQNLKQEVQSLRTKVGQQGADVRAWFRLEGSKNTRLELTELEEVLRRAKARPGQRELASIFKLLDVKKDGRVDTNEFCDVLEGKQIPDYEAYVRAQRQRAKLREKHEANQRAITANFRSMGADAGSSLANPEGLGKVEGLSSIVEPAVAEGRAPVKLLDDEERLLRVQSEIKELLSKDPSGRPCSFDDVLAMMKKPDYQREGHITLDDFETVVQGFGGRSRFSAHEVRQVFDSHAVDPPRQGAAASISGAGERYIPIRDFKDKFLPSLKWTRDNVVREIAASQRTGSDVSHTETKTESMQIDDMLAGKRPADVAKEKELQERELAKRKAARQQAQQAAHLAPVPEKDFDGVSQADSRASQPLDQMIAARGADPRKKLAAKQTGVGELNQAALDKFNAEQKVNDMYYRQPHAIVKREPVLADFEYDNSLEHFFQMTCKTLVDEARSGSRPKGLESYVDAYGKESQGFLHYAEFKEMFMQHAHPIGAPDPEEGKLLALFNLFDVQSRGKVAKVDFVATLQRTKPALPLVDRLSSKVRKGGQRLVRALTEEFQEADAPFGCHGELPLKNFQVIMADYDMPVLETDLDTLEKGGYLVADETDCRYVLYNSILSQVAERGKGLLRDPQLLTRVVVKIQAAWRGAQVRKTIGSRGQMASADLRDVGAAMDALRGGSRPLSEIPEKMTAKKDSKKAPAKQDPKKKKDTGKVGRDRRKEPESLESKLAAVVRPPKESRMLDRQSQARQAIADWLRTTVVDHMVEAAFCYGESLGVCRNIQKRFETRPVVKYIFPMMQAFQFPVQGVLPKSLQTVNRLGQLMCLDTENQLNQFDVATTASLQSVNLGTKPPLRHYNIIDVVCDQASGRIYTLNANWILEIWSIEQNASFPQKRLAVCANEGGKDFIHLYYQQTFNNAKPRFLSLQESNQQILVVNTSCVDGSIVFIDPISFSVLKKIQLRYSDYEVPKAVRDSISQLRKIFDALRENQGKDVATIFAGITNPDTQEVKIKDFVAKLARQDPTLLEEDLYKCCSVLDRDGNGKITLDEFLEFFGEAQDSDADMKNAEDELQDEMWPDWLFKEGLLSTAQDLLTKMHTVLDREHGITAEEAFGVYDIKDTGDCSVEEFGRILKIFFGEVLDLGEDLEFLMKLAQPRANRVDYRDFCKYLSKRVVRAFKGTSGAPAENQDGGKQANAPLRELEQPIKKEASLTYVLRKAAELGLDLRKIILSFDKNELNVIPRSRFVGLLLDLPLGINEVDVQEILENDLSFDNYGNVDYTVILNSDLFCHLERGRLKATLKKRRGVRVSTAPDDDQASKSGSAELDRVDNRKVVVEDLIYIDDLEILIYTTVAPKMSSTFITSVKKSPTAGTAKKETKILTLQQLGEHRQQSMQGANQESSQPTMTTNYYQLLAKLKGHKNHDPPSICYVPHSCCLVTGEKHLDEGSYAAPRDTFPAPSDPTVPPSHKFQKSKQDAYEKHQARGQQGQPFELLIWNLQRDLIELFQSRPPWTVPCFRRIQAHNSSILDICYLSKAQLVVTASTDQTIKFFDPISKSYELTDASNNPHAQMRPGHYLPLIKERTRTNTTFKEVKRIYTGSDTSCFALRSLHIQGIVANAQQPEVKSQIEWLVALKLGKPQWQQNRNTQVGFLCGYGIERVQIEVPALHHDDIVPPFILKECEEMVLARRRRLVAAFQQSLQQTITKIFSQVQLQDSFINKVRSLFMKAVLQRKELKYVNPEPLREIYNLILRLPDRTKFQSFLASSGCSDKLSVSETFFYLQKFQQIHPLRTTQIEFERSIQEFHDKHQRQFLKGIKRWPKQSVQHFADHLRRHGLDLVYLQTGKRAGKRFSYFCTRERFIQYFEEVVKSQGGIFSELEIDSILNDLDPFYTGVVQLRLLQNVYHEEIQFHKRTSLSRPNEILDDIRSAVFPNRRIALQQALASVDAEGDGYLQKPQFVQAFQHAGVKFDRDALEFLYDVLSENYTLPKTDYEPSHEAAGADLETEGRVLSLKFFLGKLFRTHEMREVNEVEEALANIKAALVYKGLDFSVPFAEQSEEPTQKTRRTTKLSKEEKQQREKDRAEAEKRREQNVDLTIQHTRFAQVLGKEQFCRRIEALKAPNVTPAKIQRLSAFLSLNQKNESTIYLNSWLHHLRRSGTVFQEADKRVLPLICAKMVRNEKVLRSWLDSCGQIRGAREEDKFIKLADLRQVLKKFGLSYINQGMFLKEYTRGEQIHVEDLIGRLRSTAHRLYQETGQVANDEEREPVAVAELRSTDYFRKMEHQLSTAGVEIDVNSVLNQYKNFDASRTGFIQAYILINVLKHNYPSVFSDECLLGLQFQLECLSADGTVDYQEFVKLFLEDSGKAKPAHEIRLERKQPYTEEDYMDLLSSINIHAKTQGLDLKRIFDIFTKQGFVSFTDIGKILELIEFPQKSDKKSHELDLLKRYADGGEANFGRESVLAEDILNQILMSEDLAPVCALNRWTAAARELDGRYKLLETLQESIQAIVTQAQSLYGESEGTPKGVLTADDFAELLGAECPSFSEPDKDLLCRYAVKGSRRVKRNEDPNTIPIDIVNGLVQVNHLAQTLSGVINEMRKEAVTQRQSLIEGASSEKLSKIKQQKDEYYRKRDQDDAKHFDNAQMQRQQMLKRSIVTLFQERDVTFFDCFQGLYDPLNPGASFITVGEFKKRIRQLNLPLSVQEQRILRRIADPLQHGKVEIRPFCLFFETPELRQSRLHKILDKVATAFFLQGFNMRRAFALFDADGDGAISAKEFRQGMAALNLHLRFDEIDDLMQICDHTGDGTISYDEFISKMDLNIKTRSGQVMVKVEEVFFERLGQAMEYSQDALVDIMQEYDFERDGTIDAKDLPKVIKKLGIMNPEPQIPLILRAGRCRPQDKRIDYTEFANFLEADIARRQKKAASVAKRQMQRVSALLKAKDMSLFEFFVMLDVNLSGNASHLEFKTGVQSLGLTATADELDSLWTAVCPPQAEVPHQTTQRSSTRPGRTKNKLEPQTEQVSYRKVLKAFAGAGCFKLEAGKEQGEALLSKFRSQLKRSRISVEKAYKIFDPQGFGTVQKKDFVQCCMSLGLNFTEDDLVSLFGCICMQGTKKSTSNDQQTQQAEKAVPTSGTRFNYKQLQAAVLVQRDENWLFQACIKIHSVVLQKGLSYRRLFNQWRDKQSKTQAGRLTEIELAQGLKKLKAGLTGDEIEKLCGSLQYEGKDTSIAAADFEHEVKEGARKLETARSFERMILQDWISQFNDCLSREGAPIERLFYEHDTEQVGGLAFEDFAALNEQLGLCMHRKDLQRIFGILDRQDNKRVRLEDMKGVASLIESAAAREQEQLAAQEEEGVKGLTGADLLRRQELNDVYENVKEQLETQNVTLDKIIFEEEKYQPNQLATVKALQRIFQRLDIILRQSTVEQVLQDVHQANQGSSACSFKTFVDFMTRKRINVAFVDKGFVDPLIAQCCQHFAKAKDSFNLGWEQLFDLFDGERAGRLSQEDFLICAQGLELGIAVEDLKELFNYIDSQQVNYVTKLGFVDALTYVTNKLGSQSAFESKMNRGLSQAKKGPTSRQAVLDILKTIAKSIVEKQLEMRQVIQIIDVHRRGEISRAELSQVLRGLCDSITLDQSRRLHLFFDEAGTGQIQVPEIVGLLQDLINQLVGAGAFAFRQVQPIISKIINELAIDADRFFDEVADLNAEEMKAEAALLGGDDGQSGTRQTTAQRIQGYGLSKRLFFNHLSRYGVSLSEQDKAAICQVFELEEATDKLDYLKLDQVFEGEQQNLYAQSAFYTVQWERRVFKRIGEYLRQQRLSIEACFDKIDDDDSKTISRDELKRALIRFHQANMLFELPQTQIEAFLDRVTGKGKESFISREAFIRRFWAAYTYDDVSTEAERSAEQAVSSMLPEGFSSAADRGRIATGLQQKLKGLKMLKAIQERVTSTKTVSEAFGCLDTGVGFLTLQDFHAGLSQHFDLTLKQAEIAALFREVDRDEDGIVKYEEFDYFYREDYKKRVKALEQEKERMITQYDIFDHLLKVLRQQGRTLEDMFDAIDLDKNQFIEVDEFHQTLESMGFVITEEQVFELMRQMDDNFDGRISYNELKTHILRLGFELDKTLESRTQKGPAMQQTTFQWRDKGLELIISALAKQLGNKTYEQYLSQHDADHDGHLTPPEFRQSLLSLHEGQLGRPQIERMLHVLLEERKAQPLISIKRMAKFLRSYKCIDEESGKAGGASLLIDEDLFVYIVERYDGFSRLLEQFNAVEERSQYISRHTHEINLRGLDMLANQMNLEKIHRRANAINGLYESTLILLAGQANKIIRDEAQLCVLDPTYSINTVVNATGLGALDAVGVPTIENSSFDIDHNTMETLPSGAQRFLGTMGKLKKKVEVLTYGHECLGVVSSDGKVYRRHLQVEMRVHRYLMGSIKDDDDDMEEESADICPNIGKFEEKKGPTAGHTDVSVVNEVIDAEQWINLDDFVTKNGGILNIPLFFHTDAPLFIARHWAKMVLKIIQKVHDVSAVLRCLQLSQVWVSRDGQRIKLGHVRGVGKVDNFGHLSSCPDIYLNLENTGEVHRVGASSTQSPGRKTLGAASSSKKTDGVRHFSNTCLDNPFIAPETLFNKYLDQTAALDVWSFGMIMYCVLLGKKPRSFYATYRAWYKKCHGHDVEMATLPFIAPSTSNFLFDPFGVELENDPMDTDENALAQSGLLDFQGSLKGKQDGQLSFENFIKCLKNMSYSSLYTQENSKKFHFKSIAEQMRENKISPDDPADAPRYAGRQMTNQEARLRLMQAFAKSKVLERKNELGLILDLISSCLDLDPKRRPTIPGLLSSPLFSLDDYELTKAVRFSQNVIVYRAPQSTVTQRITQPLRSICAHAIRQPDRLISLEEDILKLFSAAEDCIQHISSLPLDDINAVLTEKEKRRALLDPQRSKILKGKDFSRLCVSPNSPLAAQIIEDQVIDMLIFLTFRYTKAFEVWKQKKGHELASAAPTRVHGSQAEITGRSRTNTQGGTERTQLSQFDPSSIGRGGQRKMHNYILQRMMRLLKTLVYEMHSYSTPMAPYVKEVVEYVVRIFVGEEYALGSDCVLRRTSQSESSLADYLRDRSFFRKDDDLGEDFKSDAADKAWHLEQRNLSFLDKSNHWSLTLHQEANKIFKDAISESGLGQSCYPVLNDYIANVSNSFEPSKIFSKQMNQLSLSYLIPMQRTTAYYNELTPIAECLSRLYSPELEKAGKRCALAMVRSVFQTGSSDKIKVCLDLRVPKHVIHFLQDTDSEVRKECLLTLREISKGLQDDDFEIKGKSAANLKQEYSRRGFKKTAFDQHKAISMASQAEGVDAGEQDQDVPMEGFRKNQGSIPQATADGYSNYIKRTIALIEKNENERFINFALDLPNLNFLASKRFLREMAVCFESPVFIAPLTRLLKTKSETHQNKVIILQIMENLFCGSERVLTALNSPACDSYMTLLRLLMQNTKTQNARANRSGLTAQMRNHLFLQDKAVALFVSMFEQRRPTIIRDLSCIGAASTLLREAGLKIPVLISLPDTVAFFDGLAELEDDLDAKAVATKMRELILSIQDLRCWVKHFYDQSAIPELTRIKALQRCCSVLVKVIGLVWDDYKEATPERRLEYLEFIKTCLQLFDWLCIRDKEIFLFNEERGRTNLRFLLDRCTRALSQFRAPQEQIQLSLDDDKREVQLPLEDLAFNTAQNKKAQAARKYDMFPFTEISAILQNILYQLVRKDSRFINRLLAEANFGFIFGEQLILEYDFVRHCIDNKIESLVLIDSYVKKNEIRLNTFEYLLRSSEVALKDQLLQSAFIDKLFQDYIHDFREFNIQFSKIDLEFLAFRRSFPVRLECISLINTVLMLKPRAPRVFAELVMYARRHFLIKQELDLLRRGRLGNRESTTILLFAIILESNIDDLINILMQEGAPEVLRELVRDHPSLGRKFPIIEAFTSPF